MVNQVSKVNFIRLNALPEGWLPDSIYFIKNYSLTDPIADLYITDMSGNPLRVGNINLTQEQIATFFHDKRVFKIFDNITQRDQYIQSNPDYAQLFLVIDASDDPNVTSNSAFYGYRPAFTGHNAEVFFISDFESQNISLSWGNIENRPSSTVQAIDLAVANYQNIYNNLASLTEDFEDVQSLVQTNQLSIAQKADQTDLEELENTVTSQGLALAQKANQTALDALTTVVSGKATPADITAALLTGLASGSATAIAAADTLLQALAKLQAQATANAGLLAPVDQKIGSSWYVSGSWYDVEYPRYTGVIAGAVTLGQAFYIPRQILENATFTSLAFYCSTGAAGAVAYAGIYSDNAGQPGSLLASFSADCSTSGVKSGSISLSLSAGQIVWDAFLLTGGAAQAYRYNITRALQEQGGANANTCTFRFKTGQTDLAATATSTSVAQAASVPRLMLQRA